MQSTVRYGKILVIQTAFTGDVILATALLEKIHKFYSEAKLDLLVRKGNESLFIGHPFISEVLIWNKKSGKYKNAFILIKYIRSKKYDLVINLQRFMMSGLFTVFSGANETRGFIKNPLSRFFSRTFPHIIKHGVHEVDRNNRLINDITDAVRNLPTLYPTANDKQKIPVDENYISIAPTSVWFTKQWPAGYWIDLIKHLDDSLTVYLLGAPSDFDSCEHIKDQTGTRRVINMCGQLSYLESAALMGGAIMNFVNDSAPLHLATAVRAPLLAIYCSTVPAFGFYPIGENGFWIETDEDLDCRPCGLHGYKVCPLGHFKCSHIQIEKLRLTLTKYKGIFA